jgi:hypothetical protein
MNEVPYNTFKEDFLKLCDHILAKSDALIDLSEFHIMDEFETNAANDTHICGTPCCLAGALPEVFPDRFKWSEYISGAGAVVVCGKDSSEDYTGTHCIFELSGDVSTEGWSTTADPYHLLPRLFHGRDDIVPGHTDRQEVQDRRAAVAQATGYQQLCKTIYGRAQEAIAIKYKEHMNDTIQSIQS